MLRLLKKFFTRRLVVRLVTGLTVGVLLIGAAGAIHANVAYAAGDTADDDCSGIFCSVFEAFGNVIATLINAVSALIGQLIQLLADGIIELIAYSAKVVEMPAVQAGFQVSLGIVNLIFVMALIVISFQIILGIHEGEAKKQLVNVIIAAVLVNFSLLIAGLLLDISNVFTVFFMHPVTSENIRGALNPSQFRAMNELSSGGGFFAAVMPALFSLFMSAIILIILIAVFATVLMRLLRVACLLLVMPLTWGFWVFPGLDKYYKDWWHEFIKWGVVMLPTMTFFMYLGIMTVNQMANWTGAKPADQTIQGTLGGLLQMLIIGGIMVAGIKIGQEAGGISASAAVGAAKSAAGYAAKIPGVGMASRAIQRGALKPAVGKFADKSAEWASSTNPIKSMLGKAAVMSGAAKTAAGFSHMDHQLEESMKEEYDGMGTGATVKTAMSASTKVGKAKAFLALKAKGEQAFKEMVKTDEGAKKLAELMEAYGGYTHNSAKEILKDTPSLKKTLGAEPEKAAILQQSFKDKDTNGAGKTGLGESALENYQKMKPNDAREVNMKKKFEENPAAAMAMVAALPKNALVSLAQVNGENEIYTRIALAQKTAENMINAGGLNSNAGLTAQGEYIKLTIKEDFAKANAKTDPDERNEALAEVTAKINAAYERAGDAIGEKPGPQYATIASMIDKNDRLNRITSSFTEWSSGGGDDKK